jgi:arylsulfatase A
MQLFQREHALPRFVSLASFAFLAVYSFSLHTARALAAPAKPPNIVFIMADDLGYGELGCYGQKIIKTPNIDELAHNGLRFTDFHCGAPVCAPSRCVLMTGKHLGHAAIRNNRQVAKNLFSEVSIKFGWDFPSQQPLPADEVTVAELLKSQGYATAAIGKWGLGMCGTSGDPNRHGFDLFYGFLDQVQPHNHYPKYLWRNDKKEPLPGNNATATGKTFAQDKLTEEAVKFLDSHKDGPFFLYLPFTIPHLSIQVPESSLAEYKGIEETPYKHKSKGYFKHATPHAAYAAMISHMDRAVGTVMDELKKLGLTDNTLVVFTSDNGPAWDRLGGTDSAFFHSAGPLRAHKGSAYEGGIREPFIACWPGKIAPGGESDFIGSFEDVLPTLCELAGAKTTSKIDGISIVPTLLGKDKQPDHKYLYWEFSGYDQQQAVRAGKWKIIRSGVDAGDPPYELYDLSTDIGERSDVAKEHPEIVERLTKYAKEAHTPSKLFPLLASERSKLYVPKKGPKFDE